MLRFNQHRDKTPFGAVREQSEVCWRIGVRMDAGATEVRLMMRADDLTEAIPMMPDGEEQGYRYYVARFAPPRWGLYYYRFEIDVPTGMLFVGRNAAGDAVVGDFLPEWQLTVYSAVADETRGTGHEIAYHIFVDRFCRVEIPADERLASLPPRIYKEWDEDVDITGPNGTAYSANDFFGGNFAGILSKLDYLESLGVTTLYLSPIFKSSSNHRYDTGDYMKIDPMLGTEEDFRQLIEEAKKHGIGIMLDGVFNHTGADSKYFNKFNRYKSLGAYQSKDSKYYSWYTFYDYPDDYHCWWGITVVPTVNRDCWEFHNLIAGRRGVINKWTDFGVKGWRLDVVDELDDSFVKLIRYRVKTNDKNCVLIGEVWEDASLKYSYGEEREYFRGMELDGVMNYVFKVAILDYLKGGDGKVFADRVMEIVENYPKESLDCCMTLIDSHDTVRAINFLSGVEMAEATKEERRDYRLSPEEYERGKKGLKLASVLQYFLPGVPSLYYGDEAGMEGFEDPINRRPFPWGKEDRDILTHYQKLGELRKNNRDIFLEPVRVYGEGSKVRIERKSLVLDLDRDTGEWTYQFLKERPSS